MKTIEIKVPEGYGLKQEGNTYTIVDKEFELEVGEDYVSQKNEEFIIIDRKGDHSNVGFLNGVFSYCIACLTPELWRKATEEEVIEAFEKECARRLGVNWREVKLKSHASGNRIALNTGNHEPFIKKGDNGWIVWNKNGYVYHKGKWAEKLEEPKFSEKLEDIDRPWFLWCGNIRNISDKTEQHEDHLPTKELAEGLCALTQLLSFRHDVWKKEGKPEEVCWSIATTTKRGVEILQTAYDEFPFSFKTKETAQWFLETHKELLIEYFNKLIK